MRFMSVLLAGLCVTLFGIGCGVEDDAADGGGMGGGPGPTGPGASATPGPDDVAPVKDDDGKVVTDPKELGTEKPPPGSKVIPAQVGKDQKKEFEKEKAKEKDAPKKDAPKKDAPKKDAPMKDAPKKDKG